jgi:translation initiation factor 4G
VSKAPVAIATTIAAPVPAPKAPSVWGKSTTAAIRVAPTPDQAAKITPQAQEQPPARQSASDRSTTFAASGNKEKGGWRNQQPLPDQENSNRDGNRERDGNGKRSEWSRGKKQQQPKDETGWQRGKQVPLDLLKPNEGADDLAKVVVRIDVNELLALRLSYVAAPLHWKKVVIAKDTDADGDGDGEEEDVQGGPKHCRWTSDSRVQEIDAMASTSRLGGDVSGGNRKKKKEETAPGLEDCKPLEVNNDTRWTASVFKPDKEEEKDTDDVVLKKGLLIMNKLSLTKFEKLSDQFIDTGIGRNQECLTGAIELIVKKAQDEPHFAAMYAALCLKLSRTPMEFEEEGKKKIFKKMLLTQCQKEFETDTNYKMEKAIEGVEDEEERQLKKSIVKKHYLGHMRFIGELYKGDLISIKIMLMVLPQLLEGNGENGEVDEEKVECFAKLMAVIGLILEQQSVRLRDIGKSGSFDKLKEFWDIVENFAGESKGGTVSNRIKFMLQDLLEMRDNGES